MIMKLAVLLTLRVQRMLGTGFPEALHSKVMDPPFRALSCPLDGDIRILGGTETHEKVKPFNLLHATI